MGDISVTCSSSALPSSGHAGKSGYTDAQGRFEFFVPAGLTCVYLAGSSPFADRGVDTRTLIVAADRDPEPVRLRGSREPNDPLLEKMRAFAPSLPTQVKVLSQTGNDPPQVGTRTVVGRVLDQDGAPIPGVQVIYNDKKSAITVTNATDRLGVFRLTDVPPGKLLIGFDKKGYKGATATIGPEVREVKIALPTKPIPPE
jgi:Carboxypeptidase regulatory-like domain